MSLTKTVHASMFGGTKTAHYYVQIGDGCYRRGRGIFYTVHSATRIMNRQFYRRFKGDRRPHMSPSHARFRRRQRARAAKCAKLRIQIRLDALEFQRACNRAIDALKEF